VTPGGVLTVPAGSRSLTPARRQTTLVPPVRPFPAPLAGRLRHAVSSVQR
jgi:hypothetical protein